MLVIDSEKKNQIQEQIKDNFQGLTTLSPEFYWAYRLYIATVYLSGTGEPSPGLGTLSVKLLEFKVSRLA